MQSVHAHWLWRKADSEGSTGHIFPQAVLSATTLVGGSNKDGGARAQPGVIQGFSDAQW